MKDKSYRCAECGKDMAWRGYKNVEQVGRFTVNDATAMAWQCEACGEANITLEALAGYERRAAAVVLRDASDVDGAVVKYARKALGMKQADLADRIGCQAETLSRYETGAAPVPPGIRLAIVAILDGVERAGSLEAYRCQRTQGAGDTFEVPPPRRECA